jgi:hypothetical protein
MACDGRDEKRKERAREKTRQFFDWFHKVSSHNKVTENDMLRACTAEKR